MIEEASVDAYGASEQTPGGCTMLEEHVALPRQLSELVAQLAMPLSRFEPLLLRWTT